MFDVSRTTPGYLEHSASAPPADKYLHCSGRLQWSARGGLQRMNRPQPLGGCAPSAFRCHRRFPYPQIEPVGVRVLRVIAGTTIRAERLRRQKSAELLLVLSVGWIQR